MVYGFGMSPSASHQAFSTASLPAHFAAKWVDSSSFLRLAQLAGLPHLAHREQPSHARTRFRKLFGERRDMSDIVPETENRHTAPPFRETCSSV